MNDKYVLNDYFDWLYFMVVPYPDRNHYRKLLSTLHDIEFEYDANDENRANDGLNLRWYYVDDGGDDRIMSWKEPCTVLEMLVALAMNMENIMGDEPDIVHWFWMMIDNLHLAWMSDDEYDKNCIYGRVYTLLNKKYERDGEGNIFYIPDCPEDLRDVEIWSQMCWYLDTLL